MMTRPRCLSPLAALCLLATSACVTTLEPDDLEFEDGEYGEDNPDWNNPERGPDWDLDDDEFDLHSKELCPVPLLLGFTICG